MPRIVHISDLHQQIDWRTRSFASSGWRGALGRFELHGLRRLQRFEGVERKIAALLEALRSHGADHVVLTGDLTALGDVEELRLIRELLGALLDEGRLTLVPGNHDRYTDRPGARGFEASFGAHVESDLPQYAVSHGYPFVKLVGDDFALVGLDSTRVWGWGHYFLGRIGGAQLDALERLLDDEHLAGRTVLVLSHHGPFGPRGAPDWKEQALLDGKRLLEVLHGRPVVLHHGHSHQRYWHRAQAGRPHIFGGGSSTEPGGEGFWVIDVEDPLQLEAKPVSLPATDDQ